MTKPNAYWSCLRFLVLIAIAVVVRSAWAADGDIPIVHILATDPCATEGGDTATFTVFRTGPTNGDLSVQYQLAGTASNGVDYAALSGTLTIPAWASSASITIQPIDDALVEGAESIAVFLVQPATWPPPYLVCWPSFARGHIEDNDFPPTNRPPLVRLINPPDGSVFLAPVDLRLIAQASDPDGRVRSVEFFDGTNSLGTVSNRVPIIRPVLSLEAEVDVASEIDPLVYPDLGPVRDVDPSIVPATVFSLVWSNVPSGGHRLFAVATDNQGASTRSEPVDIRVTEPPPQTIVNVRATDPVAAEPDPTGARLNTATFTVHRRGLTSFPLTVYYRLGGTAQNGVDYRELPHSVIIPEGSATANVIVEPSDDALVEGAESVVLQLVAPVCIAIDPPPPDCYHVGPYDSARAVILDNDSAPSNHPPLVEIVRPLDGSVFLAPADLVLVAAARDSDGTVVTVEFFAGTNSLGVVSNTPSLANVDRPAFSLNWNAVPAGRYLLTAEATDNDGAVARSKPVEILVVERTLPPIVSIEATDAEAAETVVGTPPNPALFTVSRTGPTDRPLVVFYSVSGTASNGVDYTALPGRLSIPSGAASAPLVISPIDDRLAEGTETVGITLEPPPCLAVALPGIGCYVVGTNDRARAVIRDNEVASSNTPPRVAIVQPQDGDIFEAPADIRICALARDVEGFVHTVEFFEGTNSLGIVTNSLTVVPGNPVDAAVLEQTFCFAWRNVGPGAYELTAKATDNRGLWSVSDPIQIKVGEAQRLPVVTIEATDPFASEGFLFIPLDPVAGIVDPIGPPIRNLPDVAVFTVTRDRGTNEALTVAYSLSGTASNGVDYRQLDGLVTIPVGAWQASLVIAPIDDALVEGTETVIAELVPGCPPLSALSRICYRVGDPARAVAYIRDNDVENQPPRVAITKPDSGETFEAPANIEIVATVVDPDGYVTEVDFYAGTNLIGRDVRIFIVAPPPGQLQRFSIVWSNVPPGGYVLTAKAIDDAGATSDSAPVEIKVVEPCRIPVVNLRVIDASATEPDPRMDRVFLDTAAFRISRSCATNEDLSVSYVLGGTAANGTDYQTLNGTLVIPAGSRFADLVVSPLADDLDEGEESVQVALVAPPGCGVDPAPAGCYIVGVSNFDVVYIHDPPTGNLPPRVAIVRPDNGERFRKGAEIPIVVQALDPDGWVAQMDIYDGTNQIFSESIAFFVAPPPGQLQRFAMVWTNAPVGRHVLTARATDDRGAATTSGPVGIEVVETTLLPVVNIFATDPLAREGNPANPAVFRVRRSGETNLAMTVRYSVHGTASNGVDYALLPGAVTIPAGRRTARVVVTPIDDRLPERMESVRLRLEDADTYDVGRWGRAGAVILDNDATRPGMICLPDHTMEVRFDGTNGMCYRVELSDDMLKWEATEANRLVEDVLLFVDPEATDLPRRFYRLQPCLDVEVFDED